MQTPWAILLCKFKDDDREPYTKQRFEELFTSSGAGKFNMVDYFRDMSHGVLDLSGSKVFGWFTLDKNRSDYTGSGANQQGRQDLLMWARQEAIDNAVDLSQFFSVVVVMNVPSTDLFGGADGVMSDDGRWDLGAWEFDGMSSLSPSTLGQEMGHTYGLNHSRAAGSLEDYMDQWDVMSTLSALMTAHPVLTDRDVRGRLIFRIGPGLNAANMWGRGWLDLSRVWTAGTEEFGVPVQLRPLHRRDLPGYLAARVGPYFFEFRVPELWDAGIGQAVVLVHEYFLGTSYIHTGKSGNQGLMAGDEFEWGATSDPLGPHIRVEVVSIDAAARTATLRVHRRQDRRRAVGPALIIGGLASDGGGWYVVGGTLRRIPPRSPLLHMLEDLAALQESESISHGATRDLLRRDALESVSARANAELERMLSYRSPSPPRLEQPPDSEQV
jgi:hypothetical protein